MRDRSDAASNGRGAVRAFLAVAVLALASVGCSDRSAATITVFAASSLSDAIEEVAADFTERNQVEVRLNLAGSQQLVRQLLDGARADVFVSANARYADEVVRSRGTAAGPVVVAANALVIVVPHDDPHGITGLADLAEPGLRVALPAPEVPAGAYARGLLERRGAEVAADTLEPSVRATLARVTLGEADAAIVYASDAVAAGERVRALPLDGSPSATYPALVPADAPSPGEAVAFLDHLVSPAAQRVLVEHGFGGRPDGPGAS